MKKNTKSIIVSVILSVAAIVLISWVLVNNKKKNEAKTALVVEQASNDVLVNVSTVGKMELDNNFSVNGNFYPIQQMNFASENSGRVIKVLVTEGSV
ncbi:MAG: efflux transporter periplasmic adaptor subunit, partial [Ferruginibacter sp.]